MTLSESVTIGSINVVLGGFLEIRQDSVFLRDGVPVGQPSSHNYVLAPGSDLTGQPADVVAIANLIWTPERVAAYQMALDASLAEMAELIRPAEAPADPLNGVTT